MVVPPGLALESHFIPSISWWAFIPREAIFIDKSYTNPETANLPTLSLPKTRLMGTKINLSLQVKILRAKEVEFMRK